MAKRTIKDEYNRTRKNLLARLQYFKKKGLSVPNAPLTPRQRGESFFNYQSEINELNLFSSALKATIQTLNDNIDLDSIIEDYQKQYFEKNRADHTFPSKDDIYLSNFRSALSTKKFASGAPIINRWLDNFNTDEKKNNLVNAFIEAEQYGIEIGFEELYDAESAEKFISDVTKIMYYRQMLDIDKAIEYLTEASETNEKDSTFYEKFLNDEVF